MKMKPGLIVLIALIALMGFPFAAWAQTRTVSFDSNGGSAVAPIRVENGRTIARPPDPTTTAGEATLNRFRGWYTDNEEFENAFDFNSPITANITLYADWGYRSGDRGPGTGIIFWRNDMGFPIEGYTGATGSFRTYTAYYLEAAPSNSGSARWGANGTQIRGVTTLTAEQLSMASGGFPGFGRKDTHAIVAFLAANNETRMAAQVAAAATFGGLNDWFLPDIHALNFLYYQKNLPGINIRSGTFWSSTQSSNANAVSQSFSNGSQRDNKKTTNNTVRAIRAF